MQIVFKVVEGSRFEVACFGQIKSNFYAISSPLAVALMDTDERITLTEDEYRHVLALSGIGSIHLRAVSQLFLRLWSEAATWEGSSVAWQDHSTGSVEFLGRLVLPSLARAAALDTHALALKVSGGPREIASTLSQRRFEAVPAVNSGMVSPCSWFVPPGGLRGVSSNVVVEGALVRRKNPRNAGMAAVCGAGPVPRSASGERSFTLRIEEDDPDSHSGIYVGFVATPPNEIDFIDAPALWGTACMWRLVGEELNSNVPAVELPGLKPGLSLDASFNQAPSAGDRPTSRWSTCQLQQGDELRLSAQCSGRDGDMFIAAALNGHPVVLPTLMVRCSFAMELWPYVAACGRVRAVRLVA